jgi:hypothetical protein
VKRGHISVLHVEIIDLTYKRQHVHDIIATKNLFGDEYQILGHSYKH